ncbi:hypothetical protein G7Y89_g7908 [Cudoniella acicularis]|uniref:Uncharacterized protein n=1 Tax=Cudoniella acicularis TaxID=354080 RepID=A0A8H4RL61_9HELO|nr:hypothetical protein G7Y89_g7908 [Cudoniella acicularis]
MSETASPSPSLILARHEIAHREHGQSHNRLHHNIHAKKRQAEATTVVVETADSVVTVVAATVSYVQQIDVDSSGSTFSIETILATSSGSASTTTSSSSSSATPASTTPASPVSSTTNESSNSTRVSAAAAQSLLSSLSTTSAPTSTLSIPTSFSSFIASSNSSTIPIISSSSSLSAVFANSSTSSSSSWSSLTYLTSSSTSSESSSTSSSSSSSSSGSSFSSSAQPTTTGAGGFVGGGTGVASTAPSSTATSGSNSTSHATSSTPSTPIVVGSVVGSLAGLAMIVLLVLFLAKWRKRKNMLSLGSGPEGTTGAASTGQVPPTQPSGGAMTQRRSIAFAVPAALASLTGYNKRASQKTERTVSSTAGSERGFYRVSGRKLPSVLQSGGDGYGGGVVETNTLSGSSFYRDSTGFYGGSGGPNSPPMSHAGPSTERDSGVPVMRPSPARTPVTEHGPFGAFQMPPPPTLTPPRRPDVLGRSHPSQDGSHASRFTEEV